MHGDDEQHTLADFEPGDVVAVNFLDAQRLRFQYSELVCIAWFQWESKKNTKLARKVAAFVTLFDRYRWTKREHRLDPIIVFPASAPCELVEPLATRIAPAVRIARDFGHGDTDPLLRGQLDDDTLAF